MLEYAKIKPSYICDLKDCTIKTDQHSDSPLKYICIIYFSLVQMHSLYRFNFGTHLMVIKLSIVFVLTLFNSCDIFK